MSEARLTPQRFGRYTLLTKLASGGMASVFLARAHGDHGFARLVAIKIIHPHLLDQAEFLARFLHEGRLASQIRHPHVVSVLDVGQAEGTPYLVLDYVRGASLAELILQAHDTKDPPSVGVACALVHEALEGLQAVHSAVDERGQPLGLIHRDISPHNVLVSGDGVAYVTDLGIARARGVVLTQGTGLLGKAGYIAPEQLAKEPLTSKVDLFAMGVVLWELLTLERLFEDLEAEVGMLTGTFKLVPPSHFNSRVSPELDRFVAKLLARNPDARPRSAGEAADELARIAPTASRTEVAEWVQNLAAPRLDRLDAMLRDASSREAAAPDGKLPAAVSPLSWPPPSQNTASLQPITPPSPPKAEAPPVAPRRRSRAVIWVATAFAIGVGAAASSRLRSNATPTATVTPAATPTSTSANASGGSLARPWASTETSAVPSPSPSPSTSPSPSASAQRARAPSPSPSKPTNVRAPSSAPSSSAAASVPSSSASAHGTPIADPDRL